MLRTTLITCLLLAFAAAPVPASPKTKPAPNATKGWTQDEKLALAWLGQIGAEAKSAKAKARAQQARRQLPLLPAAARLRPLVKALHCEPASLRVYAAGALAALERKDVVRPLLWRVIRERDAGARKAMVKAIRRMKDPGSVHVLGRALGSRYAPFRQRAAEALVGLGDELAYPYLITKWEGRSGDFPQVYIALARQLSYIQDFDVEVASTSFIADPIVGVLQDATVLGVKIHATEQIEHLAAIRTYRSSLEALGGTRRGSGVKAWRRWWNENEKRLLKKRSDRYPVPNQERVRR